MSQHQYRERHPSHPASAQPVGGTEDAVADQTARTVPWDRLGLMDIRAADFLLSVKLGTRVVVRSRIDGGLTDALGVLRSRTQTQCVVETKRALVTITLSDVVAAKKVPPAPAPRPPAASM